MIDLNWYNELIKPVMSPPAWLFSPVWGVLYLTIIISFLLFLNKKTVFTKTGGYVWFTIQMLLNFMWTPAFFLLRNIGLALFIVILMDVAVFMTIKEFNKISKLAGGMLIPYFLWILFATYLNAGFFLLNR